MNEDKKVHENKGVMPNEVSNKDVNSPEVTTPEENKYRTASLILALVTFVCLAYGAYGLFLGEGDHYFIVLFLGMFSMYAGMGALFLGIVTETADKNKKDKE